MRRSIAAVFLLALTTFEASAQDASLYTSDYTRASALARDCSLPSEGQRNPEDYIAIGRCIAYFDGFRDAYQAEQTYRQINSQLTDDLNAPRVVGYYRFCWPTSLQTHPARTFVGFVDRHPSRLSDLSFDVFADAMEEAYGLADAANCR